MCMKVHGKDPQDCIVYSKHLGETWLSISCPYLFLYSSSGYFRQILGVILHFSFAFSIPSLLPCQFYVQKYVSDLPILSLLPQSKPESTLICITSNKLASRFLPLCLSPCSHPFSTKQPNLNYKSNSIISYLEIFLIASFLKEKNSKLLALAPKSALFWLLLTSLTLLTFLISGLHISLPWVRTSSFLVSGPLHKLFPLQECLVLGFPSGSI